MDVPGGDTITYDVMDEQNGYRHCTFGLDSYEQHQAIFKNLQNIQCRPDDIVLASYPKTGKFLDRKQATLVDQFVLLNQKQVIFSIEHR